MLREHLTQGYSLNEHRLAQQGLAALEQAVELPGQMLTRQRLVSDLGQEVVGLILGYARTWRLLQDYDAGALGLPAGALSDADHRLSRCPGPSKRPQRRDAYFEEHMRAGILYTFVLAWLASAPEVGMLKLV